MEIEENNLKWFDLSLFDNENYDDFSNEDWIKKKNTKNGKEKVLKAKTYFKKGIL